MKLSWLTCTLSLPSKEAEPVRSDNVPTVKPGWFIAVGISITALNTGRKEGGEEEDIKREKREVMSKEEKQHMDKFSVWGFSLQNLGHIHWNINTKSHKDKQ